MTEQHDCPVVGNRAVCDQPRGRCALTADSDVVHLHVQAHLPARIRLRVDEVCSGLEHDDLAARRRCGGPCRIDGRLHGGGERGGVSLARESRVHRVTTVWIAGGHPDRRRTDGIGVGGNAPRDSGIPVGLIYRRQDRLINRGGSRQTLRRARDQDQHAAQQQEKPVDDSSSRHISLVFVPCSRSPAANAFEAPLSAPDAGAHEVPDLPSPIVEDLASKPVVPRRDRRLSRPCCGPSPAEARPLAGKARSR